MEIKAKEIKVKDRIEVKVGQNSTAVLEVQEVKFHPETNSLAVMVNDKQWIPFHEMAIVEIVEEEAELSPKTRAKIIKLAVRNIANHIPEWLNDNLPDMLQSELDAASPSILNKEDFSEVYEEIEPLIRKAIIEELGGRV